MKNIEKRIDMYVKEHADWAINTYKAFNGFPKDKLVFVSTAHVAHMRHCPLDALFRMKYYEKEMFHVYAYDRIFYSKLSGKIRMLPKKAGSCYMCGDDLELKDIELLLKTKFNINELNNSNKTAQLITGDPMLDGQMAHISIAERYPSIRWNLKWNDYVVIGEPDGITDDFVYEFKTTKKRFYLKNVLFGAFTQADIYGLMFNRNKKRVQVYIKEEDKVVTWNEPINEENAVNALMLLESTSNGVLPALPEKWKCQCCDYLAECPLHSNTARRKQ